MRIKKFKCDTFGGLRDMEVSFEPGVNIVLGPNEAGKSTLVNAIYSTIFKNAKLRLNYRDDKEFKERWMPHPDGDYINGKLHLELAQQSYRIEKEWGEQPSALLELPDGQLIKSREKVKKEIKDLFEYGQGTYGNIVFARQGQLKEAVDNIINDTETTNVISSILRKAVMELDGISIEKLKSRLEEELDDLLKKWDYEHQRPKKNRDINNPYKVGLGKVLESYYKKEMIRQKMGQALRAEEQFEEISQQLKTLKNEKEQIKEERDRLAKIEDDVSQRSQLELQIEKAKAEFETLKELNRDWPKKEQQLEQKRKELKALKIEIEELEKKIEQARQSSELKKVKNKLNKLDQLDEKIVKLTKERKNYKDIKEEVINHLERLNEKILTKRTALEAGKLLGQLKVKASEQIYITRGLGEKEEVNENISFEADGFLKLESGSFELEIKSGEIDFEDLKEEFDHAIEEYNWELKELSVDTLEEARLNKKKFTKLTNQIESLRDQKETLLGDDDYQELKDKLETVNDSEAELDLEELQKDLKKSTNQQIELTSDIKTLEETLNRWTEKYQSVDQIFDKSVDVKMEIQGYQKKLAGLAPLPEGFESSTDFKEHLNNLRNKYDRLETEFNQVKDDYYEKERALPDESYEELEPAYQDEEKNFERLLKKARDLLRIKEVLEDKIEEMDENSFQPLIDSFSRYLSMITNEKYTLGNINDSFDLRILTDGEKQLPIHLLSAGTYDCVALALRFAILEYIYGEREGFVVLDDCLVDLDPGRKDSAVKIIKEFARNNQVIFLTCNPETAQTLSGNIIEL